MKEKIKEVLSVIILIIVAIIFCLKFTESIGYYAPTETENEDGTHYVYVMEYSTVFRKSNGTANAVPSDCQKSP